MSPGKRSVTCTAKKGAAVALDAFIGVTAD